VPPPQTEEFRDHHRPIPAMPDFDERHARPSYREREAEQRSRSSGSPLAALALALAVIAIGLSLFSNYLPGLGELRTLISRNQEPPAAPPLRQPAPPSVAETTAPPVAEATKPPAAAPAAPAPKPQPAPWPSQVAATEPPQKEPPPAPKPEEAAKIVAAPPRLPPRPAPQPTATTTEPQPAGTAKLIVAVEPQGEIYVDGEHAGTTPPLTTLKLQPGMHRIEIRNGSRKPYLTYMTVEPGDERRIRHDFNAKPSRPPA
jgi:outer membrane biosynthesis protein TonB